MKALVYHGPGKIAWEEKPKPSIIEPIFSKLGHVFTVALHHSFTTYAEHVSKAHRNVLTSFIIPFLLRSLLLKKIVINEKY